MYPCRGRYSTHVKWRSAMLKYLLLLVAVLLPLNSFAITPEEGMKSSQAAFLYPGKDFKARIVMRLVSKSGSERARELTMLRKNYGETGGDQKYFMYFLRPSDVKDTGLLFYKKPVPATEGRVLRQEGHAL